MKVADLKTYISSNVSYTYVINEFHTDTPDNCCAVILSSAGTTTRSTSSVEFQFIIRNADPEQAELLAFQIYDFFNNKANYEIGQEKVILTKGSQAVPIYIGKDDSGRYMYSVNVLAIIDK